MSTESNIAKASRLATSLKDYGIDIDKNELLCCMADNGFVLLDSYNEAQDALVSVNTIRGNRNA